MRFPVSNILELLASGLSQTDILEQHPILEADDISAALIYASLNQQLKMKKVQKYSTFEELKSSKSKTQQKNVQRHLEFERWIKFVSKQSKMQPALHNRKEE